MRYEDIKVGDIYKLNKGILEVNLGTPFIGREIKVLRKKISYDDDYQIKRIWFRIDGTDWFCYPQHLESMYPWGKPQVQLTFNLV